MGFCRLSTNGKWAVDGNAIYVPTSISISNESLLSSDSKRAESGKQYLTWIQPTIPKIKLTYALITGEEVSILNKAMQGKEFDFTYEDYGIKTIRAFARKDSYAQHRLDVEADSGGLYKNYTIEIEPIM